MPILPSLGIHGFPGSPREKREMTKRITLAICLTGLPATAQAQDVTKKELVFDVLTGPKDDTHCNVQANLFTPAGVSRANPAPAILATNGFGGSKADFDTLGPSYAKRGYVFLAYSGL